MILVTCHGNAATPESFNFIKMHLPCVFSGTMDLYYQSADGFTNNLAEMQDALAEVLMEAPEETFFFLTNSLGGIYGAHLALSFPDNTVGMVSMSTPYNGSEAAPVLGMFFPSQLFSDIAPNSKPIRSIIHKEMPCPITCIVTTSGQSSLWVKLNDGCVSRESMMARKGAVNVEVRSGHHEVCLSSHAVEIIKTAIENTILEVA